MWHETYVIAPGSYENVYVNMPAFGLGRAGRLVQARSELRWAPGRMRSAS
ncbi:monooxygenase family protein [Aestuariivirga sp.]